MLAHMTVNMFATKQLASADALIATTTKAWNSCKGMASIRKTKFCHIGNLVGFHLKLHQSTDTQVPSIPRRQPCTPQTLNSYNQRSHGSLIGFIVQTCRVQRGEHGLVGSFLSTSLKCYLDLEDRGPAMCCAWLLLR